MPTTKTSKTHGTEVILFISHQGSVQLGYVDTFPMHGTVLLQYKFPHAQQSSLSGCACGAATIKHTASCHFISAPTYIESNLSQKHLQNVPPCSPPPPCFSFPTACSGIHSDTPNRAWLTFSRQAFSTVVSLTTDFARH